MGRRIDVISADSDGGELRRYKAGSSFYLQCKGEKDDQDIQDAIGSCPKGCLFTLKSGDWQRIFGDER